MTKTEFNNLKAGDWITDTNGTFEVTREIDSNGHIGLAEVFEEENGTYHLENENPHTTYTDVKHAQR